MCCCTTSTLAVMETAAFSTVDGRQRRGKRGGLSCYLGDFVFSAWRDLPRLSDGTSGWTRGSGTGHQLPREVVQTKGLQEGESKHMYPTTIRAKGATRIGASITAGRRTAAKAGPHTLHLCNSSNLGRGGKEDDPPPPIHPSTHPPAHPKQDNYSRKES